MKKFTEVYQEVFKESAQELNTIKNEDRYKYLIIISVIIVMLIIALRWQFKILWIFIIPMLIWLILSYTAHINNYKKIYKEKVIEKFIHAYSENLLYSPNRGIAPGLYNQAEFERYYDRYHSEDLITGNIFEDCKITMGEVHIEDKQTTTDSDGHTSTTYVTLFHGLFSQIELSKYISFNLKIRKNSMLNNIFKSKSKLDMDSGSFEKIFDVNTDNKIQSMRILTSDVMQMLIDFKGKNKIVPEITIKDNKIFIRYETGNVFEPNFIKNDMDFDKLKKYYNIINFTLELSKQFAQNIMEFDE